MMVIAALLVGACFAGCSMSQGSNSLLGNGSSNESESYAEHLENNNISVAGNLGTAESVNVVKISIKSIAFIGIIGQKHNANYIASLRRQSDICTTKRRKASIYYEE